MVVWAALCLFGALGDALCGADATPGSNCGITTARNACSRRDEGVEVCNQAGWGNCGGLIRRSLQAGMCRTLSVPQDGYRLDAYCIRDHEVVSGGRPAARLRGDREVLSPARPRCGDFHVLQGHERFCR